MILVFGKKGQLAQELSKYSNVKLFGRDDFDLSKTKLILNKILFLNPSAIINAAAYTSVDSAETNVNLSYSINADSTHEISKACEILNIPLIHISTDYVFDGSKQKPWDENDLPNPINIYGKSKLKGEKNIINSGCIYVILRTSWIFSSREGNFLTNIIKLSNKNNNLDIVDDQIGGPTSTISLAKTIIEILYQLKTDRSKKGIYHYSGAPDTSWFYFAKKILFYLGINCSVNRVSTFNFNSKAKRPLNSRLDCSKLFNVFNISRPSWDKDLKFVLRELGY